MPGDLVAAARALLAVGPDARVRLALRLMRQARVADRYRRRTGQAHPRYGTGTLMSAAMRHPLAAEPRLDDLDYLECQISVLAALRIWRGHPDAQEMQRVTVGSSASRARAIGSPQASQ